MKSPTTKKLFTFIIMILSVFILVFNNSCQKETSTEAMKANTLAGSQIIYTDVIPDITKSTNTPPATPDSLDINNDGINDFILQVSTQNGRCGGEGGCGRFFKTYGLYIRTLSNNFVLDSLINSGYYPIPLNLDEIIKATSGKWHTGTGSSSQILKYFGIVCSPCPVPSEKGLWSGTIEKYLGLKFNKGQNTYCGWVRIAASVNPSSSSITIKDYAYNSIPNQPILAGQTQ